MSNSSKHEISKRQKALRAMSSESEIDIGAGQVKQPDKPVPETPTTTAEKVPAQEVPEVTGTVVNLSKHARRKANRQARENEQQESGKDEVPNPSSELPNTAPYKGDSKKQNTKEKIDVKARLAFAREYGPGYCAALNEYAALRGSPVRADQIMIPYWYEQRGKVSLVLKGTVGEAMAFHGFESVDAMAGWLIQWAEKHSAVVGAISMTAIAIYFGMLVEKSVVQTYSTTVTTPVSNSNQSQS